MFICLVFMFIRLICVSLFRDGMKGLEKVRFFVFLIAWLLCVCLVFLCSMCLEYFDCVGCVWGLTVVISSVMKCYVII